MIVSIDTSLETIQSLSEIIFGYNRVIVSKIFQLPVLDDNLISFQFNKHCHPVTII